MIFFQELKLEMNNLKKKMKALPELLSQEMDKTTKLTDQFGSMKMSNMEGAINNHFFFQFLEYIPSSLLCSPRKEIHIPHHPTKGIGKSRGRGGRGGGGGSLKI